MSTPVYTPPLDEVTTALLGLFRAAGRTVHDGAYGGNPTSPTYPYSLLYSVPGGTADPFPDLDADYSTVTAVWQITAVSNLRNQAQQLARVNRDRLLARAAGDWLYPIVVPTGWQVVTRTPDPTPAGVDRSGDTPNAIFTAPFKFALTLAPA